MTLRRLLSCAVLVWAAGAAPALADSAASASAWQEARRLSDLKRYDAALAVVADALTRDPGNTELLWLRAGITGWSGRHKEAVAQLERLAAAHPDMADDLRMDLGRERLDAGDVAGALATADEHLRHHPGDREARHLRARGLAESDHLDQALAVYERLIAENPSDVEARLGYARTLNWSGRHREAARLYRQLEAEGVEDVDVYSGLAYAEYWAGRPDLARPALANLLHREAADREGLALRSSLRRDWRPSVSLGYELSKDSDDLELGTWIGEYRQPVDARNVLSASWRGDRVEDGTGRYDLGRVALSHYRIWSSGLETHVTGSLQYDGPALEEHFLGDGWATLRPSDALRLDVGLAREQLLTRQALDFNLLYWSASGSFDWQATSRWSVHGSHRRNVYSDEARTWHSALSVQDRLVSRRNLSLTGGLEFEHLAASADLGHGYYAPASYVELGPGLGVAWEGRGGWSVDLATRTGMQREQGDAFHPYYGLEAHVEAPLGDSASLSMEMARTDSHLGSASGFERTAGTMYLTVRF